MTSGRAAPNHGLASLEDIERTLQMALAAVVAFLTPERSWYRMARRLAGILRRVPLRQGSTLPVGLPYSRSELESITTEVSTGHLLESIQVMAHYRPGSWRPDVEVRGLSHLEAALAGGQGAILWVAPVPSSNIVVKLAMHRSGLALTHLSRPSHPFTNTLYGIRFLNRIQQGVEDRYLRERVLLSDTSAVGGLRAVRRILAENRVVSITLGDAAAEVVAVPFLGATLRLSTGPAHLAASSGAALLLAITARNADGSYTVWIEASSVTEDAENDRHSLVRDLASRLESHVSERPGQWAGWHLMARQLTPP